MVPFDPDASVERLAEGLRHHYPDMPSDADVDVVTFTVEPSPGSPR
jgi:hypothetical protein